MFFFVASGFFAYTSFSNWYRGNSMCGTALGMACNGTYSFFVPLCSWIIIGLIMGIEASPCPRSRGSQPSSWSLASPSSP